MSKRSYFSQYQSPNIVIVPTFSFCNGSERKKMKLRTECNGEETSKNICESKRATSSSSNSENVCGSGENIKTNNEKTSSRNKQASNVDSGNPATKPKCVKHYKKEKYRLSKINKTKEKNSTSKEANNNTNIGEKTDVSQSTLCVKKNTKLKTPKSISNIVKTNITEKIRKKSGDLNCNNTSKDTDSNDRVPLKCTDNQYISSSCNVKVHSKQCHINKYKIPKTPETNRSPHCNKNAVLKACKDKERSTEVVNHDKRNKYHRIKQSDQSHKKEQNHKKSHDYKTHQKLESENMCHNKKRLNCDSEILSDVNNTSNDCKMNKTNKYTHGTEKHETINDTNISKYKHKTHCNNKAKLTDHKKHNIRKESSANKNTKSLSFKKSLSNERDSNKNTESKNKSEHKDKKHKLKLTKIDKNITRTREKKHAENSNITPRMSPSNNVSNNLKVTVETQSENHEDLDKNRLAKSHEKGGIKLIINLILNNGDSIQTKKITTQERKCSKTEDSRTPSIASSELSFLDDINIDEIVDSLRQSKREKDVTTEDLRNTPETYNESIIHIDDDSDVETNIKSEKSQPSNSETPIKLKKCNNPDEKSNSTKSNDYPDVKMESLEQRAQIPSDVNSMLKSEENIIKKEATEKNTPVAVIDITEDDGMIEALSDCSTIILDDINDSDIEECNVVPEKNKGPSVEEAIESTTNQTNIKDIANEIELANQSDKINLSEGTPETIPKDPIEAQLNQMFEMASSDIFDNDVNESANVTTDNTKEIENTPEEKPQLSVISSPDHSGDKAGEVKLEQDEAQESNKDDDQCPALNETNSIIDTSVTISSDTEIKNENPETITEDSKPVQTVKSEIRVVPEKKQPQENKQFIEALETRMMSFLKKKFTVTSFIHKGKHSKIYQCVDVGGFNYALKILNNTRDRYHRGMQKENMLRKIQKDVPKERLHSVYVIDGFSTFGYWCFLMEYYPKTLFDAILENNKSFPINTVQNLSQQLILAVTVLRNNNIVHSDIKPAHILINLKHDRIKLCGFDTAFYLNNPVALAPNIGTPSYRPPEVILGYSSGFSLDVWSSALVMYEMATRTKLFPGIYNNDILYKQQCTLGAVPYDMLYNSMFKENHFNNNCFKRKKGTNNEVIQFIYQFRKSKRIHRTILDTYNQDWREHRTQKQRDEDLVKLADLKNLLEQMLAIHPKHRMTIEFVYANPFIYQYSDMSYL